MRTMEPTRYGPALTLPMSYDSLAPFREDSRQRRTLPVFATSRSWEAARFERIPVHSGAVSSPAGVYARGTLCLRGGENGDGGTVRTPVASQNRHKLWVDAPESREDSCQLTSALAPAQGAATSPPPRWPFHLTCESRYQSVSLRLCPTEQIHHSSGCTNGGPWSTLKFHELQGRVPPARSYRSHP